MATGYADNSKLTHCLVALPSGPQRHRTRTYDESTYYRLPKDFGQWTCDHLIYYFYFNKSRSNGTRVVQTDWLYESVRERKCLGPKESWGGWRIW